MAQTKAPQETSSAKTAAAPTIQQQPKLPEKQANPTRVARMPMSQATSSAGGASNPQGGSPNRARNMTAVQRSVGNARAGSMMQMPIQAKLSVNTPGDAHEQEADAVARQVVQNEGHQQPKPVGAIGRVMRSIIQRVSGKPAQPEVVPDVEHKINSKRGTGQPLADHVRAPMEQGMGADFGNVKVHTDSTANHLNHSLGARAFATGNDIFFKQGEYNPNSAGGRELIAHELAHTVQQRDMPAGRQAVSESHETNHQALAKSAYKAQSHVVVSQPGDRTEREADAAAQHIASGKQVPAGTITPMRAEEAKPISTFPINRAPADAAPPPAGAPAASVKGVSLGMAAFKPAPEIETLFGASGKADVPVYLGNLAQGSIEVEKQGTEYKTPKKQAIPIVLPALEPLRAAKVNPVLAVNITKSTVTGYLTIGTKDGPAGDAAALMKEIKAHSREFGWAGINVGDLPNITSELKDGSLLFQVSDFPFKLGGFIDGKATFGLENEKVTFNGNANVKIGGAADATMEIKRDEKGVLAGKAEANITLAKFDGKLNAEFVGGLVDIQGKVGYKTEKLSGEITILVTDAATANNIAKQQLPPERIIESAQQAKAPASEAEGPKPGPRKLAGYGTLDFAFTDWFAGKATVIVDGKGDVTIIGKIAPPAEKELFAQKDYSKELIKAEIRAAYGVPLLGNIFLFANIGLFAEARIGPAKIYKIEIEGTYSTDPDVAKNIQLAASFNMSAYAGLKLRAEGGAGLELLGHDIKAGVGVNAIAGVKGYVDARPTIGYREKAAPKEGKKGEFFINGHMELAAQPFLGLGGDLFVELDSPWWSPIPDKKWTWPLGQLEYPLPGEFGLAADVDYVLGSKELPQIKFSEAKFDSSKFMTDIMRDQAPKKGGKGEQDKPATFADAGGKGGGAGGKGKSGDAKAGKANVPIAKPAKPTGSKKDKKAPKDAKAKAEGDKKKKEMLKGGKKVDPKDKKDKKDKDKGSGLDEALKALEAVTKRYEKDGATEEEVKAGVKSVGRKYKKAFKGGINVEPKGDYWEYIYVAPNKKGPKKAKADTKPPELKGLETPKLDELEKKVLGTSKRYCLEFKKYKGKQKLLPYVEGRAARSLGKKKEGEAIVLYNELAKHGVTKSNVEIEFLNKNGKVVRTRIPDIFAKHKVVGDVKLVNEQSLSSQMLDNLEIARGLGTARIKGEDDLLTKNTPFDLVVRAPSDNHPEGTHVTDPLAREIYSTGGNIYEVGF